MDLKSYFHQKYQGGESFIENVILPIFGENKYEDAYEEDVIENNPDLETMAKSTGISNILRLGTIQIPMNPTDVFDITVDNHVQMERNRVTIQALIRRIMSTYSSAFMIFHYNDTDKWDWRFSFCSKLGNNKETTDSKRYTFLLGPNQSCRTAAENFNKLAAKAGNIELEDIVSAFDVETLSKEFFDKYKKHYETFCDFVYENKDNREYFGEEFSQWEDKTIRDYVKKLLGRIVFLHFLQKKGWLGVPEDKEWGDGETDFMRKLFDNASQQQKDNYLDEVLEPLFEYGLDTDRTDKNDLFDTGVEGFRNVKVPYLNGGLFDRDVLDEPKSRFPKELFDDLLRFFSEYNFTIDENDPNDAQVGVDPEMLGRIFENLLEDNKDKGAFYTPKEIVQYMCRESLIAYLQTDVKDEESKEAIRKFVTTYDVNAIGGKDSDTAKEINEHLKQVKICDPAIGSGAFPMGLLKELFFCRGAIETFDDAAEIKRHIIQQNIYGVDIEKGAVDIARLRFWLALIVDEKTPHALPNMDFKIMQGNSLLEQYKGVDLSKIMKTKTELQEGHYLHLFEENLDVLRAEVKQMMVNYFNEKNQATKATIRETIKSRILQQIKIENNSLTFDNISDIASTTEFFLWHTWFSDVFENGGFDIVIGNPPYINVELIPIPQKDIFKKTYNCFYKRSDMFVLFLENALTNLTNSNAVSTFIVPSVVHSNLSYQPFRDIILDNHWLREVCYTGGKVFNAPTVDTTILICKKQKNDQIILKNAVDFNNHIIHNVDSDHFSMFNNVISIGDKDNDCIFAKLFKKDFPTLDSLYIIFQGIVTGNNPAFIFETKNDADTHNIESELLHTMCHGRDIERYAVRSRDRQIIYLNNSYNIENYPGAHKWLNSFKDSLKERREAKKGTIKWFCLQWPRLQEELDCTEKILVQNTRNEALKIRISATLDDEGVYGTQGINFIIPKSESSSLRYLLGVLNSTLINFLFSTKFLNLAIKADFLKQIHLPNINNGVQEKITNIVSQILYLKKENIKSDTTSLEHEIDLLVYDLYGLTKEERLIVDPDYKE